MNVLTRLFSVLSWPLWIKLLLGFTAAIIVPFVVLIIIAQTVFREVSEQNLRTFVTETGQYQEQTINRDLSQSSRLLDVFVTNTTNYNQLVSLLLAGVQSTPPLPLSDTQPADVAATFDSDLLNSEINLYESIRLLDRNGQILVQSPADVLFPNTFGRDNSRADIFRQAQSAGIVGDTQTLTVSPFPESTIEIARILYWRDGSPIGYLIATLDSQSVLLDNLQAENSSALSITTFLLTGGTAPTLFSNRAITIEEAQISPAVSLALNGQNSVDLFQIRGGQRAHTYYAPIFNPSLPGRVLFALVSEVNAQTPLNQARDSFLAPRIFALVFAPLLLLILMVGLFNQIIVPPLAQLRRAIQAMARGDFEEKVEQTNRKDEIGTLTAAFSDMRRQVRGQLQDMEARIAASTRDIEATQEISRFAATQRDLQGLMDRVVDLIVQRFPNIYHAQIFLLDEDEEYALLRASTGEPGKILLARGHRLAVGSSSVIGQVTVQGRTVIARDTEVSTTHRRNEYLPDTRAELAVPLRIGEQIIGALDVQSKQADVFTVDETSVLQTMADQLAVAIENARLYQDSLRRLREIEDINREATKVAWQDYMASQRQQQLASQFGITTGFDMSELRQKALLDGAIAVGGRTERGTVPMAVPIKIGGQTLGAVEWEVPEAGLDDNKMQLAQELANRLGVALDNARLFQESQRAAERERLVNTISAKLTPQTELDQILQTAVREVGQALRVPQVSIRLNRPNGKNGNHENG